MFRNDVLARPGLAVDPIHDGRHELGDKPFARESIPYLVNLPEEGIALFTYTWADGASSAGAALAIFGPGVGEQYIQQKIADRPVSPSMNFDAWSLDGFAMKQDLAFNKAQVRWENEAALVEFEFEAFHPPYAYASNKNGCPPFAASNRIEQSGRAKGELKLRDKVIRFDTTGHRDHSWGTRDWQAFQHYKWFQGQAGDSVSVHFWQIQALGRTDLLGYVYKDGLMAEVVSVDVSMETDGALWQKRLGGSILDEAGRQTSIDVDVGRSNYPLIPDPALVLNEGAGLARIDGKPGVGWLESAWPKSYLDHIRSVGGYK